MKRIIIFLAFAISPLFLYAQEQINSPKIQEAKSKMVLRSNTRDQICTITDNVHRKQQIQRRQVSINRQQMMNKKRMQQFQYRKIRQKQHNMQTRRLRQQAIRQQQKRRGK